MNVTKKMVQPVYKYLRVAEICSFLPVSLDVQTWKFTHERTVITTVIYSILFYLSCGKNLYLVYSFVRKVKDPEASTALIILIALWCSLCSTTTFWSYELFQRHLNETISLFNWIQFAPSSIHSSRSTSVFRSSAKWIQVLSPQELLIIISPYALNFFAPMYVGLMIARPRWDVFVTAVIPESYLSSPWLFGMLVGIEGLTAFFMECNLIFLIFLELGLQTTFVPTLACLANNMKSEFHQDIKNPGGLIQSYIKTYKTYHLVITLCNVLFNGILFTAKLMTLTCSIFGTYFVLAHARNSSAFLLTFFAVLSLESLGFFIISSKNLFDVPKTLGKYKLNLSLLLEYQAGNLELEQKKIIFRKIKAKETQQEGKNMKLITKKHFRYSIKALIVIGINDGGFRRMDRISTLLYLDFFFCRVISLLLL